MSKSYAAKEEDGSIWRVDGTADAISLYHHAVEIEMYVVPSDVTNQHVLCLPFLWGTVCQMSSESPEG